MYNMFSLWKDVNSGFVPEITFFKTKKGSEISRGYFHGYVLILPENNIDYIKDCINIIQDINENSLEIKNRFYITNYISACHIVFNLGMFSSIGQAKKNGWNFEIPNGINYFHVNIDSPFGKIKKPICIYRYHRTYTSYMNDQ